jgi:hypothetical protein
MFIRPEKRIPNPMAILPMDLEFLNDKPMMITIPIIRALGARVDGLKICSHTVEEESI